MTAVDSPTGPLEGIRVLDFSSFIAGCYSALMLGDLGAEVVKVEPLEGDGARHWGPFLNGESRFFQGWNRNKRSIAVDMRSEKGLEIVHSLATRADVIVENFRPGITKKLNIDYETLHAENPRLVYCSITGFGRKGPMGERPGYDPILQSMSGAAKGNERYSGGITCIGSVAMSDYGAGLIGSNGILAALYLREKTGKGQLVETSLLQAAMALQSHFFVQALETEEKPPLGIYPYRLFESKDSFIFIAGPTNKFWKILCDAIDLPHLVDDPRYNTNANRVERGEELTEILQPIFRTRTSEEWHGYLVGKGVPCGPVYSYDEFFDLEQVAVMDMKPKVSHPTIGDMHISGVPFHLSDTPGGIHRPAPTLGEHNREVLSELGYAENDIETLEQDGVIS